MKSLGLLIVLIVACTALARPEELQSEREKRLLSLFAIVQFKNNECSATNGLTGSCFSSTECSAKGGAATGNCAAGFGVCCVFQTAECGATNINQNCTYIANSGYPSTVSGVNSCAYTISYCNDNICQLRLDFENLVLTQGSNGAVDTTANTLTVDGPTSQDPPVISGTNTGKHMYVETGRSTTATSITLATITGSTSQSWNIKVSQIECDSLTRAPDGCTQYFTGNTGTITSYAFPSSVELRSQEMSACIRAEEGMCQTDYYQTPGTSFSIGAAPGTAAAETTDCTAAALHIPNSNPGTTWTGFVCDNVFASANDAAISGGVITQNKPPFFIAHTSDSDGPTSTVGFSLNYLQKGC